MKFEDYKLEIDRIVNTTCIESSMYKLIQNMIEEETDMYAVDISQIRTKNKFYRNFKTNMGPSDIALYESNNKQVCFVEVKWIVSRQSKRRLYKQLSAQIQKHRQLLFTDGLNWKYYVLKDEKLMVEWEVELGVYKRGINWNTNNAWKELRINIQNTKFK